MGNRKRMDRYEGMRTRGHWKPEQAARVLSDWASSGETLTGFARQHELALHRLQWWRSRLGRSEAAEVEPLRFVAAVHRQAPLTSLDGHTASAVSLSVGTVRLEINDPAQADPRWLAALVAQLLHAGGGRP